MVHWLGPGLSLLWAWVQSLVGGHVTLISRSGSKTFDYIAQLYVLDKVAYGIIDKIHSFDDLADSLHLTVARQKQYDELKKKKKEK